jgi:ankyrin repeat protein/uncharacterized protein
MTFTIRLFLAVVATTVMSVSHAASFDCTKARSFVEELLCQEPELEALDDTLDTAYRVYISDPKVASLRRIEQRRWLKQRDSCRDRDCVKAKYQSRLKEMKQALGCDSIDDACLIKLGLVPESYCSAQVELTADQVALYDVLSNEDFEGARRVIGRQSDVNFIGPDGWQPLQHAVIRRNVPLVQLLIDRGADPNASDCRGVTPLEQASRNSDVDIVKVLLAAGARPNVGSPLNFAAFHGSVAVATMLLRHGADPNRTLHALDTPPLLSAIRNRRRDMVAFLLDNGANANPPMPYGITALSAAMWCGTPIPPPEEEQLPIIELLIRHGANPNARFGGRSVLWCAMGQGAKRIEALLISAGAKY